MDLFVGLVFVLGLPDFLTWFVDLFSTPSDAVGAAFALSVNLAGLASKLKLLQMSKMGLLLL